MAEPINQFRAALHGYNREDVVDYIDRMTQEHDDTVLRLQKANAKLREELDEANEALTAAKQNPETERALSDAQTLIADLRKRNGELEERVQSLEAELEQARTGQEHETAPTAMDQDALERLQNENTRLQEELEEANEALSSASRNKESEMALSVAQTMIADLRGRNDAMESRIQSLEEELRQAHMSLETETASMSQAQEGELDRLREANDQLRNELAEANEALTAARDHSEAENALSEAQTVIADLRGLNADQESRIQGLEEELRQAQMSLETETASMSQAQEDELGRLREVNDRLRNELAEANEALSAARDQGETENALTEAQTVIADLRGLNADQEIRIQGLEAELEQLRAEVETARASVPAPMSSVEEAAPAPAEPAKNYEELELAAYRRAEQTERLARDRAEETYRQVQSVFGQANGKLDACRAELEQLSQVLTSNVNEMLAAMTNLNDTYRQTEESFAEIGARDRQLLEENF